MKNSGVEWLGEVPAHWEQLPGHACFTEHQCPNKGMIEETVLSLSYGKIVVKPPEKLHGLVPASFETYQVIDPGDIIIRPTDLQNDWNSLRFGYSTVRGIITSAYMCFHTESRLSPRYGHLLLHTYDLKKVFYGLGSGLRQNLDWRDFKYLPCAIPPLTEQAAIVRYLGYVERRIQRYVRTKRKLLVLLAEQKQAIIHRAVTRGLDPDVPLKPSGVEWLGDVPAHWEVVPLKHWLNINKAVLPENTDAEFKFYYIDIGSVGTGMLTKDIQSIQFKAAPSRARRIVRKDDTIVSTVRTYLKSVWFAENPKDNLVASTGFAVLTPRQKTLPKLVSYVAQSNSFTNRVTAESVGIAYPAIAESRLGTFHVSVPPLSEQTAIAVYLDKTTAKIDAAIARARREIALLSEYRTRLIADVVTGKVDVREASVALPETDPLAAADEVPGEDDALTDSEDETMEELEH